MRKKLLRSRSGFEKPESREEAIMQNILGASNVLEPSESNIEEILKSILYNTPYTKEAEFEIEKILLAIKNNGTYDGEGESRDMKILIAILNDLDYTEEAESRIEELFIEWLHQRSSIKVLEGIPPLTFTSLGLPLINYLIEGNTVQNGTSTPLNPIVPGGTGERTSNLFDISTAVLGKWINSAGEEKTSSVQTQEYKLNHTDYIVVEPDVEYTFSYDGDFSVASTVAMCWFNSNKEIVAKSDYPTSGQKVYSFSAVAPSTSKYCIVNFTGYNGVGKSDMMFAVSSSAALYEPFGYKIPIVSADQTANVYLGDVQTTRKIKKLILTGEESFVYDSNYTRFRFTIPNSLILGVRRTPIICSHYEAITDGRSIEDVTKNTIYSDSVNQNRWWIEAEDFTTADDFKAYLAEQYAAGTPVIIWYILATEETGIVNEPLMKIGDYADTLSMEQSGVQIPTNNGTTVIDVDTIVKPSNVYIEYK